MSALFTLLLFFPWFYYFLKIFSYFWLCVLYKKIINALKNCTMQIIGGKHVTNFTNLVLLMHTADSRLPLPSVKCRWGLATFLNTHVAPLRRATENTPATENTHTPQSVDSSKKRQKLCSFEMYHAKSHNYLLRSPLCHWQYVLQTRVCCMGWRERLPVLWMGCAVWATN